MDEKERNTTEPEVVVEKRTGREVEVYTGSGVPKRRRLTADKKRSKIIELHAKKVPMSDISRVTGVPRSTVKDIIDRFKPVFKNLERVEEYREVKSDLLAAGQLAALESAFSGAKLRKASFATTLKGFDILNKAERLDSGESTENISMQFGRMLLAEEEEPSS